MENGLPVIMVSDITSIHAPPQTRPSATGIQMGGAIFALAGVVYTTNYLWRRKTRRDAERAMYTKIGMAD